MNIREIKFNQRQIKLNYRDDSDESVIEEIFKDRLYRRLDQIIPVLTNPIVDVGAHIGVFSLYAGALNPKVKIFALEPEPKNFELLKENNKLNRNKNIVAKQCALHWDEETTTSLYLSPNNHNHSTVKKTKNQLAVPAIELDKFLTKNNIAEIGLIKLDVEGAEFNLLPAWTDKIWNKINYIALEYHETNHNKREELEDLIRSHGFSLEHFPSPFDKRFGLLIGRNKKNN
jgi:FkbM family methyltransferase